MPRSYWPDNSPIEARVDGNTVHLTQPVEQATGIRKEIVVTLAPTGTAVTIENRLTNTSLWTIDAAVWAMTIMNAGGAVILPQEPYKSHDEALQPARSVTLWSYTDLSDPRWKIGTKFLRLKTDASMSASQKVGVANHQGWAGYLRNGTLFVKRVDWKDGGSYPDGGVNVETYTAGTFLELETLGVMTRVEPGATITPRGALVPVQGRQGRPVGRRPGPDARAASRHDQVSRSRRKGSRAGLQPRRRVPSPPPASSD